MKRLHYLCCLYLCVLSLLATSCSQRSNGSSNLSSVNIIDRNGFTETISSKERLGAYEKTNFLNPQPYQKVMRVFQKDSEGNTKAIITSYHPNGQIRQYLEAFNARAQGMYREWHQNGQMKVEAHVIGGAADLNTAAEQSWLFDGHSYAWDETGSLIADIAYEKGLLSGTARYYHPNKTLSKIIPYQENKIHGTVQIFDDTSKLIATEEFKEGALDGLCVRYWKNGCLASSESYQNGLLESGEYFDLSENVLSKIVNGEGTRIVFSKTGPRELQEYHKGVLQGLVRVFHENGHLLRTYSIKNGLKHGEEIEYYSETFPSSFAKAAQPLPKLLVTWHEGVLQGLCKTWYDNGQPQSQRELSRNKKNGISTAWYRDGSLMLVEEYQDDKLAKGQYFKKDESVPISNIHDGKGIATLFDEEGAFLQKVKYLHGRPEEHAG